MILPDNEETRIQAAEIVQRGGLIGFRTDTFYGLGADPMNHAAVWKLKELKGRDEKKPILVLIADVREVVRFVIHRSTLFDSIAESYWPGPLTLVGEARPELPVELTAGSSTIGVRLPDDDHVRSLLRLCGGSLTGTSANLSGEPDSRTAQDVEQYFHMGIDLILDRGAVNATNPSTVVDLRGEDMLVIREGTITGDELRRSLAKTVRAKQ
jgi:L-threonylcarbamoyladenylate synthase